MSDDLIGKSVVLNINKDLFVPTTDGKVFLFFDIPVVVIETTGELTLPTAVGFIEQYLSSQTIIDCVVVKHVTKLLVPTLHK